MPLIRLLLVLVSIGRKILDNPTVRTPPPPAQDTEPQATPEQRQGLPPLTGSTPMAIDAEDPARRPDLVGI